MYAVIETGGKQYKVQEGEILYIERLDLQENDEVVFDKVVLLSDNDEITVGLPYVEGTSVSAKLLKNGKGPKIRIFKMKAKKGYRKRMGHRQPYSKVQIETIKA